MPDAALTQLLDMGIPRGRAAAALKRSKGDAMTAAERVFAGEFDDVPSDEEMDVDDVPQQVASGSGPSQSTGLSYISNGIAERVKKSVTVNDNEEDDELSISDGYADEEDIHHGNSSVDPYANVFFSKDRVEEIIEPIEEEEWVEVGSGALKQRAKILGRGAWMSGCPEGNEQSFLFQLYFSLENQEQPCSSGCQTVLRRDRSDFFALHSDFPAFLAHLQSVIEKTCPKCAQKTCMACGEQAGTRQTSFLAVNQRISSKGKGKKKVKGDSIEIEVLLHCPNIQGVIIGMGLHMIERAFAEGKSSIVLSSPPPMPTAKRKRANVCEPGNEGEKLYDSDDPDLMWNGARQAPKPPVKGVGYGGAIHEDRSGQIAAEMAQSLADEKTAQLLRQVRTYLPSFERASGPRASDHMVHPTALAHLRRRSGFVNDLLRNDSLLDMSKRGELYRALFDWLKAVSSHESLASMLAMPQMRPGARKSDPNEPEQVTVTYEGASSPRELLENVVIQAQAALKGLQATSHKEENVDAEAQARMTVEEANRKKAEKAQEDMEKEHEQLKLFCETILNSAEAIDKSLIAVKGEPFVTRMRASLPKLPEHNTGDLVQSATNDTEETRIKIYEGWASRARFQYCDMSEKEPRKGFKHAYSASMLGIDNMCQNMPKRSLAIAKELAILTTSLPAAWNSTIFLRVDEVRVDCLKAMIIGPQGTPYENGCFLFDIFLPLDYNIKCPVVKSMTTNGGRYRYNPNLYADGKVCLSLLGTWSGPGWVSGQSTLLQVLISIQSLILCEEPYLNEPGWANQGGTKQSKMYSANIRRMVLLDAMANNIKNPPAPFENEIKTHFRLKSRYIRQQLTEWKRLDDGLPDAGENMMMGHAAGVPATPQGQGAPSASLSPFDKAAEALLKLLDELDASKIKVGKGKPDTNKA